MERLPTEQALKKQTEAFKAVTFGPADRGGAFMSPSQHGNRDEGAT
jgi:hypothetical protein